MNLKGFVGFWVDEGLAERLKIFAATQGMNSSELMRNVASVIVDGQKLPVQKPIFPTKARREGKITVRLPADIRKDLEEEAMIMGYPTSSWAAAILAARQRASPQVVRGERKVIQRGFGQLRGMATNINQIATAMNRGVFTGDNYAPTTEELRALRLEVANLRSELKSFAAGRYKYQTGENDE